VKANQRVLREEEQDKSLVLVRSLVRLAIDTSGWKHEAVAAAMSAASGLAIDSVYLSKILSGEKRISVVHVRALPAEIEVIFARLYAQHFGLIVLAPACGQQQALEQLVNGLVGLFALQHLPARADRMAHAELRAPHASVAADGHTGRR
jgi:hypothetical protein